MPALTIAKLYQGRWHIELFFKWLKQHLRIKAFYGTSENAVRVQIWSAIAVYLLVALLKKRLHLDASLYTILQILSLTLFEKTPILQVLAQLPPTGITPDAQNHPVYRDFQPDSSDPKSIKNQARRSNPYFHQLVAVVLV